MTEEGVQGLTAAEVQAVRRALGREPRRLEWELFAVLWSEHCSYKHSRLLLRRLPTGGERVLAGPGENAGVLRLGEGWAVVAKVESHNHPSAIEPLQGAATGLGGILRDVLAMGARPIAFLDSLRFGDPSEAEARYLLRGVVAGIAWYGNAVGVPTVGGEIAFLPGYRKNPLVNVMCVGVVREEDLRRAGTGRPGARLVLLGPPTGRDGIHGATFASAELSAESESRRPSVQVGDPFMGKLLTEATLDILAHVPEVQALQDLGAAGLASAVSEMAGKAGAGAVVDVARVPRREEGMTPVEVMLSESQERMLLAVPPAGVPAAVRLAERWGLRAADVGELTEGSELVVRDGPEEVARVPVRALTDGVPLVTLSPVAPEPPPEVPLERLPEPRDLGSVLLRLLAHPDLADRSPVYTRFDYQVGGRTVVVPGGDAAVLRVPDTSLGIAVAVDGGERWARLDPYQGARWAVAEAYRNVVAVGGRPIGLTNAINLGDPDQGEVAWQLERTVAGLADACRELSLPVTGGNVSLYNETAAGPVPPTVVVGMLGVLPRVERRVGAGFQQAGDRILLVGGWPEECVGGSLYLEAVHGILAGPLPALDLGALARAATFVLSLIDEGIVRACHDVGEGGLAVALAEMALWGQPGARGMRVSLPGGRRADALLFGESPGRFLVVVPGGTEAVRARGLAQEMGVPCADIGDVGRDRIQIYAGGRAAVDMPASLAEEHWRFTLARHLGDA